MERQYLNILRLALHASPMQREPSRSSHYNNGLLERVQTNGGPGVIQSVSYTYNTNGDVTEIQNADQVVRYFYDENGNRVLEVDAEGNYVKRVFSSDNLLLVETKYSQASTQSIPAIQSTVDAGAASITWRLG